MGEKNLAETETVAALRLRDGDIFRLTPGIGAEQMERAGVILANLAAEDTATV